VGLVCGFGCFVTGTGAGVLWWVVVVALAVVFLFREIRVKLITNNLFNS